MDASRFDTAARSLGVAITRRGALATLLGGSLTLLGLPPTIARKKRKKRKNKSKSRNTKTVGPQSPPGPTCSDGMTNGSESDVDCGGSCPRCANLAHCGSRDDCASAHCQGAICQECSDNCALDIDGRPCFCDRPFTPSGPPSARVCDRGAPEASGVSNCGACDPGTTCVAMSGGLFNCYKLCGAP